MRLGTAVALADPHRQRAPSGWAAAIGWVALLVVFAIALNAAAPVNQAPGQRVIYSLRDEARGRINALYMTIVFVLVRRRFGHRHPGLARGRLASGHAGRWLIPGHGRRRVRDRALQARVGGDDRA